MATEREKTPDEDSGYLWRLNAYWRFEQAGGGVLIECESVRVSPAAPSVAPPALLGAGRAAAGASPAVHAGDRGGRPPRVAGADAAQRTPGADRRHHDSRDAPVIC